MRHVSAFLTAFGILVTLLVMTIPRISAESGEALPDVRLTFIETSAIPAIEAIIQALETGNAPVPPELTEFLSLKNDPDMFYAKAEQYFGLQWKEQLARDASSLRTTDEILAVRTRIYLSSLGANADIIAEKSPLEAGEIQALALNLLRESRHAQTEEEHSAFAQNFAEMEERIFPQEERTDLFAFRANVQALLTETSDATEILVEGNATEKFQTKIAALQSHLQLVTGGQELAAWIARFDAFVDTLLAETVPTEKTLVIADLRALLTNLRSYLTIIRNQGTGEEAFTMLLETEMLLAKTDAAARDENVFEELLTGTEQLLSRLGKQPSP